MTTVPHVNEIGYLVLKTILKYQKHLRTLEIKEFKNRPHFCFALEKHNVENNEKNWHFENNPRNWNCHENYLEKRIKFNKFYKTKV